MAGKLQPLAKQFPIINDDGTPTEYFIRWAQDRQIDISEGITGQDAQDLIDEWAADRAILTGVGLAGGGSLSQNRTLYLDAGLDDLNDVDLTTPPQNGNALLYNSTSGQWVPGTAGGGGGGGSNASEASFNYPDLTTYQWLNQRGATVTKDAGGSSITSPYQSGGAYTSLTISSPSGDFEVYGRFDGLFNMTVDYPSVALVLRSTSLGRGLYLGMTPGNSITYLQDIRDDGAFFGNKFSRGFNHYAKWFRFKKVGNILYGYASDTGVEWNLVGSTDITGWGIDRMGFGFIPSSSPDNAYRVSYFGTGQPSF